VAPCSCCLAVTCTECMALHCVCRVSVSGTLGVYLWCEQQTWGVFCRMCSLPRCRNLLAIMPAYTYMMAACSQHAVWYL
jgi:hypothetical protein